MMTMPKSDDYAQSVRCCMNEHSYSGVVVVGTLDGVHLITLDQSNSIKRSFVYIDSIRRLG